MDIRTRGAATSQPSEGAIGGGIGIPFGGVVSRSHPHRWERHGRSGLGYYFVDPVAGVGQVLRRQSDRCFGCHHRFSPITQLRYRPTC